VRSVLLVLCALLLAAAPAVAQDGSNGPDPSKIKVRFGPVILDPSLTIGNVGEDGNVFNDSTEPKRDFTMTVTPRTEWWVPFMKSWFSGLVAADLVWYQTYASERSGNGTLGVDWSLPLSLLTVNVAARRLRTRDRPGLEIDERALRTEDTYSGSVAVHLTASTSIGITGRRDQTTFDEADMFDGVDLGQALNRTSDSLALSLDERLTPLTTLTFGATREQDRFAVDPLRNADSTDMTVGVRFSPLAVLNGGFAVGYTRFTPQSATLPDYAGPTMKGDLAYVLLERTKFTLKAQRGIQYSYEDTNPYYIQTALTLEVAQQLIGPTDVAVRGGLARLDYRDQVGAVTPVPDRIDHVHSYGVGFGYHLGPDLRIGFNADRYTRQSAIDNRNYTRPTYGASLTYDF
jgi:hypothetical protein